MEKKFLIKQKEYAYKDLAKYIYIFIYIYF